MTQPSSYGSWPSPVTADYVHGSTVGRGQPWADGEHWPARLNRRNGFHWRSVYRSRPDRPAGSNRSDGSYAFVA